MAVAPRTEADSKVSIDCSRCSSGKIKTLASDQTNIDHCHLALDEGLTGFAHVERGEALAVRVELLVVEFNELLCGEYLVRLRIVAGFGLGAAGTY